jgi:formiminotetrahydrofolate cyclodeaminase
MPRFADMPVSSFLDALASAEPTPGGGTAAAIAGGIGVSLLMMVSGLTRTKTNADNEQAALREVRQGLAPCRDRIVALADVDTDAFNQVMAAYRLPKATDPEKTARKQAIQAALRAASDAPLDTLRATAEGMAHARVVAAHGNPSAASDIRVAIELLEAAGAGAAANVEVNIVSIEDVAYRTSAAEDVMRLTNQLVEDAAAARAALT